MKYNETRILEKKNEILKYIICNKKEIEKMIFKENEASKNFYEILMTDIVYDIEEYGVGINRIDIEYQFIHIDTMIATGENGKPTIYYATFETNFEQLKLEHIIE